MAGSAAPCLRKAMPAQPAPPCYPAFLARAIPPTGHLRASRVPMQTRRQPTTRRSSAPSSPGDSRRSTVSSVLSLKYEVFCCDQNGPPARREEGAYLNRYVNDEQRSRRPIFIATLWAGASWLFFRVARSTRMTQIWALRSRLEKQPTDLRQNTSYFGDRTLVPADSTDSAGRPPLFWSFGRWKAEL